jgi:hypothetical protein
MGSPPDDAPIFVLGAGWRTGSTLLQRLLNATPGTLIWGEPFGEGAIIQRLAESTAFLDTRHGRSRSDYLADDGSLPSPDMWTANLTPPLPHLVEAQRAMIDRLFKAPALEHGCARWGVKEVVWGRDVIDLLTLLYPRAKLLLLVRDPVQQWHSYRPITWRPWFYRWPEVPIGGPVKFGRMWNRLVKDFVEADRDVPQATLVRYEDLGDPAELDRLSAFLCIEGGLRRDAPRVGSSDERTFYVDRVPAWERAMLRRLTARTAEPLGYH